MADATYEVLEMRIVIEPDLSHLYVLCGMDTDGSGLVVGWWHKALPSTAHALEVLVEAMHKQEYLTWDRGVPKRP